MGSLYIEDAEDVEDEISDSRGMKTWTNLAGNSTLVLVHVLAVF